MDDAKRDNPTLTLLVERLAATLGKRRFETWFESQVDFRLAAGGELQVTVGTPLEREHLQRRFAGEIRDAYAAVCGAAKPVAFRVDETGAAERPRRKPRPTSDRPFGPRLSPGTAGNDRTARDQPPTKTGQPLGPRSENAFDKLVVGDANHDAVTIARQIAEGVFPASPVVLWGSTGVGKTQLLRAIQDGVRGSRRCRAIYLTAEQFLSGFVEAVHDRGLPSFRHKHRGVDLLILDDVQMLLGKRKTLEELQHTLDALVASGSQVVLGSDRGPSELTTLGGELASRLAAGVAIEVKTPGVAMRRELLDRLAEERGVLLEPAARDAVAGGLIGGARELSGAVNRMRYETGLFGDPVDEGLARRVVADVNRQSTPRVKPSDVLDAVCRVFGVEASLIKSGKRTKAASEPRMLAMWLARKYTRSAWSEIGEFYGKRRHSTVISACHRVDDLIQGAATVRLDGGDCTVQEALRRVEAELRTV